MWKSVYQIRKHELIDLLIRGHPPVIFRIVALIASMHFLSFARG
jgi:hypothetical protein